MAASIGVTSASLTTGAPATADGRRALRAQYFGMVSEVDAQFGRVVAALKASGQWDDTVVVLTACARAKHGRRIRHNPS